MRFTQFIIAMAVATLATIAVANANSAINRGIEDFYGEYVGSSGSAAGKELKAREINVKFKKIRRGFNVSWSTMSYRATGEMKRKSYSIDFRRTRRENIYQSSMRKDVFGNGAPNDPMKGDPYVWARIIGDTLSVYALIVRKDGGYDMQVYHRTLTQNGLQLSFTRFLEGEAIKTIEADLRRVSN